MSHGSERRFDGIGGPEVNPVFSGKVVKRQQSLAIFGETFGGLGVFRLVGFQKQIKGLVRGFASFCLPDVMQLCLGRWLQPFGQFVQREQLCLIGQEI